MRRFAIIVLLAAVPVAAHAQARPDILPPGITVGGSATIRTAPDLATIKIELRGEGATADAASLDLQKRQRAVIGGLVKLDPKVTYRTGSVAAAKVRKGDCAGTPGNDLALAAAAMDAAADSMMAGGSSDDARKGPCRVVGYVASIEATVELCQVKEAGTAIGLATRLGAASANLDGFALRNPEAARRAATVAAMADAQAQAQDLAAAAGARLGPIVTITGAPDRVAGMGMEQRSIAFDVATMTASAPPIPIDVSPQPVETNAQIFVVYSLVK